MYTNTCQLLKTNSSVRRRLGSVAAILAIGLLLAASSARADVFDFTSDHCSGGCGDPPFGTVTLTQNGANVDITVSIAPNFWAKTGSVDFLMFKFNDTADGITAANIINESFDSQTVNGVQGTFNGDGTGAFSFGIACTTCKNGNSGLSDDLSFTVTGATLAGLEAANANGNIFVADIFSAQTGKTGPVDVNNGNPHVPDSGSTALLLGLSLFGLGFVRMPLRKKA
jgi:protein with PEP-CTERM/exosortase system signal